MPTRLTGCSARDARVLHVEDRDLHRRRAAAAVLARPVDRRPSGPRRASPATRVPTRSPRRATRTRGGSSRFAASHARTSSANACSSAVKLRSIYRSQKRSRLVVRERLVQGLLVVGRERDGTRRRHGPRTIDVVAADAVGAPLLVHERALHDLVRAGRRRVAQDPDVARPPLRADARPARRSSAANAAGSNVGAVAQHEPRHHLVAGLVVGHAVDRGEHHVGVARERGLDRAGREVLAVDADPVGVAPREVEVAVVVEVAEVAASSTSRSACVRSLASGLL